MELSGNKPIALIYGLLCHGIFLVAGTIMFITILTGFKFSVGPFEGFGAVLINLLLLIQFPIGLHNSYLNHV